MLKKFVHYILAAAIMFSSISTYYAPVSATETGTTAQAEPTVINLALRKPVVASGEDTLHNMPATKAVDGIVDLNDRYARWAYESRDSQYLRVDLEQISEIKGFRIVAEDDGNQRIAQFKIEGSNDDQAYTLIHQSDDRATEGFQQDYSFTVEGTHRYRYVKLTVEKLRTNAYPSVSLREFEVRGFVPAATESESASDTESPSNDTAEVPASTNIARGKPVTASNQHETMPASKAVDGVVNAERTARWSAEAGAPQWLEVDLAGRSTVTGFRVVAENDTNQRIAKFKIEGSMDKSRYDVLYQSEDRATEGYPQDFSDTITAQNEYRFVKITVEKLKDRAYPSVSLREFEVLGRINGDIPQADDENVAAGKTVVTSSHEASTQFTGNKLVDGNKTGRESRWASAVGNAPHWFYIDLGAEKNIKTLNLYWETRKATDYSIQLSNANPSENQWRTVKHFTERVPNKPQRVTLDHVERARYVKVLINAFTAQDPDSNVSWNNVSLYEVEVFGGEPPLTLEDSTNGIRIEQPTSTTETLVVHYPENTPFDFAYNGTDYEQVIGENLKIYRPILDKTVKVSFKITNRNTGEYVFKEMNVTVPGKMSVPENANLAPHVLPEVSEWVGAQGNYTVLEDTKVVVLDPRLQAVANALVEDYRAMTGKTLAFAETAKDGDIVFNLTTDESLGLQKEGYLLEVGDRVNVTAYHPVGAFWATRTILQSLLHDQYIPKGTARDYPLYPVRGFVLDVGRKTFTIDYLKNVVKFMAWYKLNDFHVHLNDNLIPLENYSRAGKDPMQAYSGFRLESDIREGGANGLYKADLTSKDVWYTKQEFKQLIEQSRVYGVNIVPEIDTPAHSLALTRVRPDLRHGTYGRDNDHLDLIHHYDESLDFVKTIFNEYMQGDNPVFDRETTIHIGADEYTADGNAYRRFSKDLLEFVRDSGRKPRIWGSFTRIRGNIEVRGEGYELNLWSRDWSRMKEMYDLGYDLINTNDGHYYIVPNAGYYYDYLNNDTLYNLPINTLHGFTLPAGDKKMLGAAFAVWNDMIDMLDNGVSEYDVYVRIKPAMSLFGAKLWGKQNLGLNDAIARANTLNRVPNMDFEYKLNKEEGKVFHYPFEDAQDVSANARTIVRTEHANIEEVDGRKALRLNGGTSFAETPVKTAGLSNSLSVKVKRLSTENTEQILFESPFGSIKAVQKETGKVGFTRENYDYSFNYTLPVNQWVELTFENTLNVAKLYVDGQLVDTLGDNERVGRRPLLATMMYPVQYIGSQTKAFNGYVSDLKLGDKVNFVPTVEISRLLEQAHSVSLEQPALFEEALSVLHQYNPDSETVRAVVEKLKTALAQKAFEPADYSRVNHYKALIPEDLSIFTEDSVHNLNQVLATIQENLPLSLQVTVDHYELALKNALQGLTLKAYKNVNYYDSANIRATASSNQSADDVPQKAFDGDENTMWHTNWTIKTMPHWIQAELTEPALISALSYLPRRSGNNGNITHYRLEKSEDGRTFETVAEGRWPDNSEEKRIEFAPTQARFFRLVALEAANRNGAAAEIKLIRSDVAADKEGLSTVLALAEAIDSSLYTAESVQALNEVKAIAKTLLEADQPNPAEVEQAKLNLRDRMTKLILLAAPKHKSVSSLEHTNLTLSARGQFDPTRLTLSITKVDENAVNSEHLRQAGVKAEDAKVFKATVEGDYEAGTRFTLRLPREANRKVLRVVHIPEQGDAETFEETSQDKPLTVTDQYVELTTTSLSPFVVVYASNTDTSTDVPQPQPQPQPGTDTGNDGTQPVTPPVAPGGTEAPKPQPAPDAGNGGVNPPAPKPATTEPWYKHINPSYVRDYFGALVNPASENKAEKDQVPNTSAAAASASVAIASMVLAVLFGKRK